MLHARRQDIALTPFIIALFCTLYTWSQLLLHGFQILLFHWSALALVVINLVVYYFDREAGLICTGIILILATFCLASFFLTLEQHSFYLGFRYRKVFETPDINWYSLYLLLLYCVLNAAFLKTKILHWTRNW